MIFTNIMKVYKDFNLSKISWFKTGGVIKYFYIVENQDDLLYLFNKHRNDKIITLGACSNVLINDNYIDAVALKLSGDFNKIFCDNLIVTCGCGASSKDVSKFAATYSISGLEFLFTIPGTIGGNIRMNAGCYYREIRDIFDSVKVFNMDSNKIEHWGTSDISFEYRKISRMPSRNVIFLEAKLTGLYKNSEEILSLMKEMNQKRLQTQPSGVRTCGSTFKNPDCEYKAWQLIDMVGLRGFSVGGASFSQDHCNFIVVKDFATSSDIENLCNIAIDRVFEQFSIKLEMEIERIP
jgi:UDP-N-acetylmuramate dehydrogenase